MSGRDCRDFGSGVIPTKVPAGLLGTVGGCAVAVELER
jgi:hypothetical protein